MWSRDGVQRVVAAVALAVVVGCGGSPRRADPEPPREQRFLVRTMERVSGELVIRTDGLEETVRFEYNDRGRGPALASTARYAADGRLVALTVSGVDYWKAPVDETYQDDGATRRWRSQVDEGERAADGPGFYIPHQSTLADEARLIRALIAAGGRVPLLPSGEATLEVVDRLTVDVAGQDRQATLYAITGISLMPSYLWFDGDAVIGSVGGWGDALLEGWQEAAPALLARQERAVIDLLHQTATSAERPAGPLVFRDVGVFDSTTATVIPGQTVIVRGDRIEQVGASAAIAVPAGAVVIDGRGHTLLPGLWDMHVHIGRSQGPRHLAAGVTSARDLASNADEILGIRADFDDNRIAGPRLILGGFMDGSGDFTGPTKAIVDDAEQAAAWVDRYAREGYEQIKIYSSIKPALVPVIVELAHDRGLRVSGHIPHGMTAAGAVEAGFDELQHANFVLLQLLGEVGDTRTPVRFTAIGERGGDIDLGSDEAVAFFALLRAHGTVVDPTVAAFEDMLTARPGTLSPEIAAVADRFPVAVQRGLYSGGLPVTAEQDARYRAGHAKMIELVGVLYRAGIPLVAGTDGWPGFGLHRELEHWVAAGIPAGAALRIATLDAARLTGRDDELGSIVAGKLADLVLVQGDPTRTISDLRNTAMTVKGGLIFDPTTLYATFGIRHPIAAPARLAGAQR